MRRPPRVRDTESHPPLPRRGGHHRLTLEHGRRRRRVQGEAAVHPVRRARHARHSRGAAGRPGDLHRGQGGQGSVEPVAGRSDRPPAPAGGAGLRRSERPGCGGDASLCYFTGTAWTLTGTATVAPEDTESPLSLHVTVPLRMPVFESVLFSVPHGVIRLTVRQ